DLKPENILLDSSGHIRLTDFGSAIKLDKNSQTNASSDDESEQDPKKKFIPRNSFVGTAQYVSPEHIKNRISHFGSDLWAFGVIAFQLLSGYYPFSASHEYRVMKVIVSGKYEFPDHFDAVSKDFIDKILKVDPNERLGYHDISELKSHPFFNGIDWMQLTNQRAPHIFPEEFDELDIEKYNKCPTGMFQSHMAELLDLQMRSTGEKIPCKNIVTIYNESTFSKPIPKIHSHHFSIINCIKSNDQTQFNHLIKLQSQSDPFHQFTNNSLILKQGILDKKVGLFSKTRRFIILTGPLIVYIEESSMQKKGEILWTKNFKAIAKNFSVFYIHTPKRVYYLTDKQNHALEWVDCINKIHDIYFK
ncbi:3-phosphoinositide-dependent protein kinase 1, partial [Intoshia linei]